MARITVAQLSAWIQWIGEAEKEATAPREPRHPMPTPKSWANHRPTPTNRRKRLFR